MYPIATFATPLPPSTPEPSVASLIAPSQPVLGRLPATQVNAAIADVAVQNHTQGGNGAFSARASAQATLTPVTTDAAGGRTGGYISSYPTLFLAQLMGQDPQNPHTQTLVLSYQQWGDYANVKYMPSNIGKPEPYEAPVQLFTQLLNGGNAAANTNTAALQTQIQPMLQAANDTLPMLFTPYVAQNPAVQTAQLPPAPSPRKSAAEPYAATVALFTSATKELLVA